MLDSNKSKLFKAWILTSLLQNRARGMNRNKRNSMIQQSSNSIDPKGEDSKKGHYLSYTKG